MEHDNFIFDIRLGDKPNTRRGFLSLLHSIYDPLGFVAPLLVQGKLILRDITRVVDWDEPLEPSYIQRWEQWKSSLSSLETFSIPRMYVTSSLTTLHGLQLHVFCDASQNAISAVAYIKAYINETVTCSFVFGKVKLEPSHGHTIPRLELCAAVLATEVSKTVKQNIHVPIQDTRYYSDSKVVLGYIHNKIRRFYNYVSNRVQLILATSLPSQWYFVSTKENPADHGTRGLPSVDLLQAKWLRAPEFLYVYVNRSCEAEHYPLVMPDMDKEVRINVNVNKTVVDDGLLRRIEKLSTWSKLVSAIALIKAAIRRFKGNKSIEKLALCQESEQLVIKLAQQQEFLEDINSLNHCGVVEKSSPIASLSPFMDDNGILRVGGKLNQSVLPIEQRNPIILSKHSYIAQLIAQHYHISVAHQGRQITEGSIRNNGYWIIGANRLISSLIHNCVTCRKLRRQPES